MKNFPNITLNNGVTIPAQGYGVFKVPAEATAELVAQAIKAGYRHIDTAAVYFNEQGVGEGIRMSGVPREEIFVTSKLWLNSYSYEGAKAQFQRTLDRLGLDYLDLYLIHWPFGDWHNAWRAMEELYEEGKIRAIGVSNFDPMRVADLIAHHRVVPAVNQLQIDVFRPMTEEVKWHQEQGIQVEAWGPLGQGNQDMYTNPVLLDLAAKHGKTVAQVVLRWHLQRNVIALPKTSTESRMVENQDILDFSLSDADMELIASLDQNLCPTTGYLQTGRITRFKEAGMLEVDL